MDQTAQTSFIPKKPLTESSAVQKRPIGIFTFIGTIVFLASIVSAIGVYVYKTSLTKSVTEKSTQLQIAQNAFEPGLINDLQILDKRIDAASAILSEHITLSPVFKELSSLTIRSVRYTKFSYTLAKDTKVVTVSMGGQASDYNSIALQANAFNKSKAIRNVVFSNLTLDDQGKPSFDLSFTVDASFVKYTPPAVLGDNL